MPSVTQFLKGEKVSFFEDDPESKLTDGTWCISPEGSMIEASESDYGNLYHEAPVGSIMVIRISGTIMKEDSCGAPGTDTMSAWVKEAVLSDNIAAIVFVINSGGGSVEGTGEFADVIKWADAYKPVIAYTDGLLASAAYWIASACRRIFASFKTVEVGSIGTAIRFLDNRKAMEEYGYKEHYINADASIDKNQDYYKALDGNYTPIKTHILNPTNDIFIGTVRINRAGKLIEKTSTEVTKDGDIVRIEPISGNVYLAESAIEWGLIDEIGSFEYACEYALSEAQSPSDTTPKSNNMFNKFSKLAGLAGKAAASITADMVEAVNQQISAAKIEGVTLVLDSALEDLGSSGSDAALVTANTTITDLNSQITALTTAKQTAEASVTALTTDRDAWKAKAVEYGAKAADEQTQGVKHGTDTIENTNGDDAETENYSEADAELAQILANRVKLPKR